MAERQVTKSSSGMQFALQGKIYDFVACFSNKISPVNISFVDEARSQIKYSSLVPDDLI